MKSHNIIAIVAALACTPAAAQGEPAFWRYAAVTAGRSAYDIDCLPGTPRPCDNTDRSATKLAVGGKFNDTWGIEIGYVNLGDVSLSELQGHTRAQGADLSLVASATVFDRVGINARIGGVYGWTHSRQRATNLSCIIGSGPDDVCNLSQGDRGLGVSLGAGLSARVAPHVELRLDWDRYRFPFVQDGFFAPLGKRDVDLWSAGFNFLF